MGGVIGHRHGEGMRCVNDCVDAVIAEIGGQSLRAAEAADSDFAHRQAGLPDAASEGCGHSPVGLWVAAFGE